MIRIAAAACLLALIPATAIAAKPLPDLVVKKVSLPFEAVGGSTATLRDTVTNAGTGAARPSTTAFYLSFDKKLDDNDIRLKETGKVARLARGRSAKGTTKIVVPVYLTGQFEVLACADDAAKVRESSEKNNCRSARAPLTIQLPRPN